MFMGQTLLLGNKSILINGSRLMEDRRIEEIADPKMIEKMGQISEQELCQMEAFRMLSLRCIGPSEEVPTMVEVAKELKKIQTSLQNDSSSPSGVNIVRSHLRACVCIDNILMSTRVL
ncbi:unnamed protein product [Arabidopsis lyrata]|nr:unnamed protein product [Arabidopsis lyrata]